MKIFFYFYSLFIFIANMEYAYSSNMSWDSISDQQIESCLSSDTFQNISLPYLYEDRNWELRIIFNPHYEKIALNNGQPSMFQFYYGVFSQDRIPQSLEIHLKEIIASKLKSASGGFWCISSTINGKLFIDYFADAAAIPETRLSQTNTQNEVVQKEAQINGEYSDVDQEICDLFKEQNFRKISLNYEWEGKSYSVHFVHNPMREVLCCSDLSKPVRWPFAMTIAASSYPLSLANHLKSLVPDKILKDSDSVIDVADWVTYCRKNSIALYTTLHPITLLNRIENPDIDVEILTFFNSNQLSRRSFYYQLDGCFYKVYLIHNPEKLILKSTIDFNTWENGRLSSTVRWNSKIGIFVDKVAPKELIDHISHLYKLSWSDSYWNLSIHNGDKVSITHVKDSWRYTYTPCSWYTCILNAKL
jgi:hypothetical protein